MSISEKEVLVAARLAKLELDPKDVTPLTLELTKILGYVDQLSQLDTTGVEPTTQVGMPSAPLRPDLVTPSASKAEVLGAAPRADDTGFLVPGFVDGS
jgi:aspartyl-tRNA(Asn)/glutamyl-tRNA(Gln) amidotransferase subunit C